MKRVVDFLMKNNYAIVVFAVAVFGIKLLFDYYTIPEEYLPWFDTLEMVFLTVFIAAVVNFFSIFIIAWATRRQPEHWWEKKRGLGEKLLNIYTQSLIVSIPVIIYGTFLYFALFVSWRDILVYAAIFIIGRFISHWQASKKQRLQG